MLHTTNPEILFLKQEDVVKAGLLDMKQIIEVTEKTYSMLGKGQIKNPPKTNTSIPDKENWQSFFNSMPCYYISAILYLLLNIILGKGINIFEVRLKRNER